MKNLNGRKCILAMLGLILALLVKVQPAEAARNFTVAELNTPQPVEVTMGDTVVSALTYSITNTCTGGDASRGLYRLIFTAPAGFTFTGAPVLPTGWAISGTPGQSITLLTSNANPCTNCITVAGGAKSFTLTLGAIPAGAQDTVSTVSVQARFTGNKNTTRTGTFVTRRSLKAVLVAYVPSQCTPDCINMGATCTATPSINIGSTHNLALIVTNNSTSNTWTGVISNPSPPAAVYSWAGGGPAFNAPASITLAPGACGVVVWTVTMPAGKSGTVSYQARARNSTNAATSIQAISNTVIVSALGAAVSQTCVFPGETTTVTMTATNNGAVNLTNVRPGGMPTTLFGAINNSITTITVVSTVGFPTAGTIRIDSEDIDYTGTTATTFTGCVRDADRAPHTNNTPVYGQRPFFIGTGTATPTYISGPTPASIANLAPVPASGTFTWTYRIDGAGTYSYRGLASALGGIVSPPNISTAGTLGYFDVTIGSGATQGAGTLNNGTNWNITNNGCQDITRVDIAVPGGFTVVSDGYDSKIADPPTWNEAYAGGTVSFTAGTNMTGGQSGTFTVLFSGIPGTGVYPFPVTVYDTFGRIVAIPTNVTVDTSLPGSAAEKAWEEPTR